MSLFSTGLDFAGELFVVIIRRLGRRPRTPEGVTQEAARLASHTFAHVRYCVSVCGFRKRKSGAKEGFGPWHQGFHGAGRSATTVEAGDFRLCKCRAYRVRWAIELTERPRQLLRGSSQDFWRRVERLAFWQFFHGTAHAVVTFPWRIPWG